MLDEKNRNTLVAVILLLAIAYASWRLNTWLAGKSPASARNRLSAEIWVVLDPILP